MLLQRRFLSLLYCLSEVVAWDEEQVLDGHGSQNRANPLVDPIVYYFAYGSNMHERIMRMKCPDATLYGSALLKKHRLDFTMEVPWWNGAVATICKDEDSEVWGILWMIKIFDMDNLEEQEGVYAGWSHSKEVIVLCEGRDRIRAITYIQNHSPKKLTPFDVYPPERRPSLGYIKVMIIGAIQGGIPDEYIKFLYTVRHNGKTAAAAWKLLDNRDLYSKHEYTKLLL